MVTINSSNNNQSSSQIPSNSTIPVSTINSEMTNIQDTQPVENSTTQTSIDIEPYMKQFEDTGSTDSIPVDIQVQLLQYFEDLAIKQTQSNQNYIELSKTCIPFVPPSFGIKLLQYYNDQIDKLQKSIDTVCNHFIKFTKTLSTDSIPINLQKEFVVLFKEQIKRLNTPMDEKLIQEIVSKGGCVMPTPPEIKEKMLKTNQCFVDILEKSIQENEASDAKKAADS